MCTLGSLSGVILFYIEDGEDWDQMVPSPPQILKIILPFLEKIIKKCLESYVVSQIDSSQVSNVFPKCFQSTNLRII